MANTKKAKYPLAWHIENVQNSEQYTEQLREKVERIQKEIARLEKSNLHQRNAILEAKKKGITELPAFPNN